ncbi:MAG: DUF1127 domain-containing protein [Desulfuromusa sp.]|nr:DUF1127 domain-containing protein [Desulfuromusa sp.]
MILSLFANKVSDKILFWREISRERQQLNIMSDYLLKDIGISRTDAIREARRPFWDCPAVAEESLQGRTGAATNLPRKRPIAD